MSSKGPLNGSRDLLRGFSGYRGGSVGPFVGSFGNSSPPLCSSNGH